MGGRSQPLTAMTLTASLREFLNIRGSEIEVSGGITSQGGRPRSRSVASWTTKPATGERILLESLGADFVELFPSGISLGVNHRYCRQRFSAALAIRSCASTAGLSSIHRAGGTLRRPPKSTDRLQAGP